MAEREKRKGVILISLSFMRITYESLDLASNSDIEFLTRPKDLRVSSVWMDRARG